MLLLTLIVLIATASCGNSKKEKKQVVTKDMLLEMNRQLINTEANFIKKHLEDNGEEMHVSESGLWYNLIYDSIGTPASKGQLIHLVYNIEMLNGTPCYSSDKNGLWTIEVGEGNIETGMQEAIGMLSVGDSANFIMPPHLAHGLAGDGGQIPGRTILRYNIRVILIEDQHIQ